MQNNKFSKCIMTKHCFSYSVWLADRIIIDNCDRVAGFELITDSLHSG